MPICAVTADDGTVDKDTTDQDDATADATADAPADAPADTSATDPAVTNTADEASTDPTAIDDFNVRPTMQAFFQILRRTFLWSQDLLCLFLREFFL